MNNLSGNGREFMENLLPQRTDKPWGFELLFAHTSQYAGKVIFVKKGHRLSLQYHRTKDETVYVYQGKVMLETRTSNGEVLTTLLHSGQNARIPPGTVHRLKAVEDSTLFEVSTPELEDIVRLEDDYGRADEAGPCAK